MDAAPRGGVPGSCGVFARIRWSLSPATTAERQTSSGGAAYLDVVRRAGPVRLGPSRSHRAVGDLQRRADPDSRCDRAVVAPDHARAAPLRAFVPTPLPAGCPRGFGGSTGWRLAGNPP